jgi:carbamoyl-phosphate synthase large subunit
MSFEQPYSVMRRSRLQDREFSLRAVQPADIEAIRKWRNAQMDVLRQSTVITPEAQEIYFAKYIWPGKSSPQPSEILLAIERHGQLIGYGGLVHISWDYQRAEISFLLEPRLERDPPLVAECFTRFLRLIHTLAFEDLQLRRLTTETYALRKVHIQVLEAAGHRFEGRLKSHVLVGGEPCDALIHGLLAAQWRKKLSAIQLPSVLVTSAGGKVPLIHAMQSAAERLLGDCQVWAGDTDPLAPTRWEADAFWHMPPLNDGSLSDLIQNCLQRGISIVLPTRDGELNFWARHREAFAQAGIQVLVSDTAAVDRCRDKLAFARFGREATLPIIPADTSPDAFGQVPLVVKERFGAGSRCIGLKLLPSDAREHARQLSEPLYQPFIHGPEISIDSWVSRQGEVAGVVLRRRDRVVAGESQVTTTFGDEALEAQAVQVIAALGVCGPVVLQAIVVDGALQVIECNPRFGGASTTAIAAGLDSLFWSLAEAFGQHEERVLQRSATNVRQVRSPNDRWIYGSDF